MSDHADIDPGHSLRVLRVIPSYFPYVTGPANQARAISTLLAPQGFISHVVTTNLGAPGAPHHETLDGVEVTRLPIRAGFMQYHVTSGAWRAMRSTAADVVHVHSYRNFLADTAAIAARHRHVPLVLHLHGSLTGYRRMVTGRHRHIYRAYDLVTSPLPTLRADRFIVSTRQEAEEVERYGLDMQRVRVIPMGIDPGHYMFPEVDRRENEILFAGRLAEDRNVEQLLRALALIDDLPWSCKIVGGEERRSYASQHGYVSRLKGLAAQLGIADRITFTGPLYGEALRRTYAGAGIFVYTSRYENFGQTILEAAAAGCALVVTPVGIGRDLVENGTSGFLVQHDSADDVAERLRWLLLHRAQSMALGRSAQDAVRLGYSLDSICEKYLELYRELIDEFRPSNAPLLTSSIRDMA